jgi:hypothetical protein
MAVNKYVCACDDLGLPVSIEYREESPSGTTCQVCSDAHTVLITTKAGMDALLTPAVLTDDSSANPHDTGIY